MPLRPVALYGVEVPPGDHLVPAVPDLGPHVTFPGFRITMAAIDPNEEADPEELKNFPRPRATLKIIRHTIDDDDEEEDEEFRKAILEADSDSDSASGSDSDEELNGGPSDPAKSKKARKEAAVKELIDSLKGEESDEEMEEANGVNGAVDSKNKGKAKATEEDEEESESENSEDSMDDDEIQEYVVCTLDPDNHYQQTLDISIGNNELVFFRVTGTHTVFLTGNYHVTDEVADEHDRRQEFLESDYPSEDDSEDSDLDLSPDEDELVLDMDDESDELDDLEDPRITEVDSDDEEAPKLIKTPLEKEKKGKNKRTADELDEGTSLDEIMAKSLKSEATEEPKLSKKQMKKLKKNNGEAGAVKQEEQKNGIAKDVAPAKSDKSDKKVQFAKNLEQGPTGSAEKPKAAEKENGKTKLGPKKVNGVTIDDKKVGAGPSAKKGDRVGMRYIGKLNDGKVFDSNKSGKPFSFKLGTGEVIKGWDIGVAGMSVGGERRLTIPANLAYGSKSLPGIPANSTLIFDIKLLEIK